jgi:hypothetical protein
MQQVIEGAALWLRQLGVRGELCGGPQSIEQAVTDMRGVSTAPCFSVTLRRYVSCRQAFEQNLASFRVVVKDVPQARQHRCL